MATRKKKVIDDILEIGEIKKEDLLMNTSKQIIQSREEILKDAVREGSIIITEKDTTPFNKKIEEEEELQKQKDKLPLDKILEIAKDQGLLKDLTEEQRFDRLIKGIKLHDIIKDCMQSSLNNYCTEYNKKNPEDNLGLKLHLRKVTPKGGVAFSAKLELEVKRRGLYKVLLSVGVSFNHVREVRDEQSWKYSLYGNMFNLLITNSINHLLLTDDVNSGRIKSNISKG